MEKKTSFARTCAKWMDHTTASTILESTRTKEMTRSTKIKLGKQNEDKVAKV